MSKGYTADGKRISASTHARRSWTCACGKEVFGNGGRSSHQRACLVYMGEMLAFHERILAELIGGERRGSEAMLNRHGHEVDVLRERIAARELPIKRPVRDNAARHPQPDAERQEDKKESSMLRDADTSEGAIVTANGRCAAPGWSS